MLKGFEDFTAELSDYERETLLPLFIQSFTPRVGRSKAVTNKEIVAALKKKGYKISDARVRKIINHIRTHDLVKGLIATSDGYYVSHDITEVADYCDSLAGRENEIHRVRESMENYRRELLKKIY